MKHILTTALVAGVGGWLAENALFTKEGERRYSPLLPGIPFLPVYAAGGALMAVVSPALEKRHIGVVGRFAAYGALFTAVEGIAGYLDRWEGRKTWDYAGHPVDLEHACLWGLLGLVGEGFASGGAK